MRRCQFYGSYNMAAADAVAGFRVKLDSIHCARVCDSTRRQTGDEGRRGVRGEVALAGESGKEKWALWCGTRGEGRYRIGDVIYFLNSCYFDQSLCLLYILFKIVFCLDKLAIIEMSKFDSFTRLLFFQLGVVIFGEKKKS